MKTIKGAFIMICCLATFCGRGKKPKETVTNKKIPYDDITEFYYTYENINFNAYYQRYRFYKEDGGYMFYHETREKPGEYGPTTKEDITAVGTFELPDVEWKNFIEFIKDGTVSARKDTGESGNAGPWSVIYWKNDKRKYQTFDFKSYGKRLAFEEFCYALARKES